MEMGQVQDMNKVQALFEKYQRSIIEKRQIVIRKEAEIKALNGTPAMKCISIVVPKGVEPGRISFLSFFSIFILLFNVLRGEGQTIQVRTPEGIVLNTVVPNGIGPGRYSTYHLLFPIKIITYRILCFIPQQLIPGAVLNCYRPGPIVQCCMNKANSSSNLVISLTSCSCSQMLKFKFKLGVG